MKKYLLFLALISVTEVGAQVTKPDSLLLSEAKFRLIGPWRGGRSAAVCGHPTEKNTFYMGATGGGVWKTMDGGSNWKNISDGFFGGSIGAVACAPSDPDIMYVGEGENTVRGNVSEGWGMWKSLDGGRNWKWIGLKDTRHIIRIVVHPKNPDVVWIAALGHLFGPNEERGVYKTVDGGKTWKKVLFSNKNAGAVDLVMEPGNPDVLYASTWNVRRTPYSLESGGEGSAIWKSTDGGNTWKNITANKGFPKKETIGIIGIAVSKSNPQRVYAIMECKSGGLFRSDDAGKTWENVNSSNDIRQRAWYFSKIFVDPENENLLYILNVSFYKSTDGGKTHKNVHTPHGDHHDLWIDPKDGQRMIIADDGGGQISFNGGNAWSTYYNQPTSQLYRVSTDNHFPYRILAAQQDNSSLRILHRTYGGAIGQHDWEPTAGFESGYIVADPTNPDIVYGGNYGGYLSRLNHKTGENRTVSVWPDSKMGSGADAMKYRFQWNFPVFFSPHNPKRLYAAGNMLFVTENEGQSWKAISPDLTTNDKTKQVPSGGPITKDNTTVEFYCTIFTATESEWEKDLLWAGSDDGLIHVSKNGGANWENVTPKGCPAHMMWNCVEVDPFKKGAAWFVGTRYKLDDYTPYLYYTEDYGKTWKVKTKGIPATHFTRCLRADRKVPGLLYAGTEFGFYISWNGGTDWMSYQNNLPIVSITDLAIKDNDLIVGTQGRAIWVLDNLNLVQQYNTENAKKNFYVFDTENAWRMQGYKYSNPQHAGENPPNGVVVHYWLKSTGDSGKVTIKVLDEKKELIDTYKTGDKKKEAAAETGLNTFVWNMNYASSDKPEGLVMWNGGYVVAKAPPGKYIFRIIYGKDSLETAGTIVADPNYACTSEDYKKQFEFLREIQSQYDKVNEVIVGVRKLSGVISELKGRLQKENHAELITLIDTVNKHFTKINDALFQGKAKAVQDILNYPIRINDRMVGIFDAANSGYMPPQQQVVDAFTEVKNEAKIWIDLYNKIIDSDIKRMNQLIHDLKVDVLVKPEK